MVFHYTNSYMVRVGRVVLLPLLLALAACTDANVSVSMLSQNLSGSVNVSISSSAGSATNLSSIPVDVKFSEDVENISSASFEVTNGTIQTITGSGANYSLVVVPNGDGAVSVKFLPGKVDIKKNSGSFQKKAAGTPLSVVADTVAPMVLSLTSLDGSITNKSVINFKVEFSEPVTGFDINQLSVSGAGAAVTGVTGSGSVYNVQVSVSITGQLTLYALPGVVRDGAGNLLGTSSPISVTYDPTLPIPVLSSSAGSLTNLTLIPITVDFGSVSVTGLTMSDFVVAGATISGFSQAGSIYTVTLSPTADGVISISLPADAATSLSGVASLASNTLDITVDRVAPVIAIGTPTPSAGTSATEFKWLVTYSGASLVTLNSTSVNLLGSSTGCSKNVVSQSATTYYVIVTGCSTAGPLHFTLLPQTAQDAAGNYAPGATASSVIVDNSTYVASFATQSDFVSEGSSPNQQSFSISLSSTAIAPVTINYRISKALSSAVNNADFVLSTSSITIPSGSSSATINYIYNGDPVAGGSKVIQLGFSDLETASGTPITSNVSVTRRLVVDEELPNSYSEIAATTNHSCGITSTGVLKCWGSYLYDTQYSSATGIPVVVDAGVTYSKIATGNSHSCGITSTGVLKCWGGNSNGQLGDSTSVTRTTPVVADSGFMYKEIAVGTAFTCGITSADELRCWGLNGSGQLGIGSTTNLMSPTFIDPGVAYNAVTVGSGHTCALTTAGVMKCWGSNSFGQVGNGTTTNVTTPYTVDSGAVFSSIATGAAFSCGVTDAKKIKCWGLNAAGQLGIGSTTNQSTPTVVDSAVDYVKVSAGSGAACGITSANTLKCWGLNALNALGDGTLTNATAPIAVDAGATYSKIAPGGNHMCGILTNGITKCWGANLYGQTGDGLPQYVHTPKSVEDSSIYEKVSTGVYHSCGIISGSRALKCWGDNSYGQLGDGSTNSRSIPFQVDKSVQYAEVSVGHQFTCAITTSGILKCWGENQNSKLGDGTSVNRKIPTVIDSGVLYSKVSAQMNHACGITTTGVLKCWGLGSNGQLGTGSLTIKSTPAVVDSGVSYAGVATGEVHSCGLTSAGVLKCWGGNSYYQVSASGTSIYTPTVVDAGVVYTSVAAGMQHSCGLTADKTIKCWGYNASGQVGIGSTGSSVATPTEVIGGENYNSLLAGSSSTCGFTTGGQLKCWGYSGGGQLGDGTFVAKSSPTSVITSGDTFVAASAGSSACAINLAGALKCWGSDSYGQLGLGRSWGRPLPIIP